MFNSSVQHPKLLSFDHILSSNVETTKPLIILYADVISPSFVPFHQFITDLVNNEKVEYVLRYKPPKNSRNSLYLAGYGVELALKKTDYIVIDDRKVESGKVLMFANN
jgi:UDP-glucose:glycoprotein glucosyltransferase